MRSGRSTTRRWFAALALLLVAAACGGGDPSGPTRELVVAINAPFSKEPFVGTTIAQGAQLAADQINDKGGVDVGGTAYRLRIVRLDNGLSPQQAVANMRRAIGDHAVAVIDEGTGIDASWQVANAAHLPVCIVYQGGEGLVDLDHRPNVFRIAPTDHGIAFRLAEYVIPKGQKVALMHDDTDYGQEGHRALRESFGHNPESVAADLPLTAGADPGPQVLEARRSGATALLVWARGSTLAQVIRAARSSGWGVPVYAPASGEDPVVRQQLSDHPEWVDGLTFAAGRMTAEVGPGPFLRFQSAYEKAFGPDLVGVKTSTGKEVVQPPDYTMYPYDFVHVLAAALEAAHTTDAAAVLRSLNEVDVKGANGDNRGFNEKNHEGVVDDDVYFAVFHDMTFAPVKDDPLSSTLDVIRQTR
ncbi:MAG TPA: ABC transporter substrate-binding protein [Actinomycetota bacterium]|nr:ABC transporter substrate-binding protein [Actinomycetota bacterium]